MRHTIDETRALLLDTGLRLLKERGLFVGVTHVRLSEVVAEAGMTTGAAYRCWDDQEAFHRDLALAAVRFRDHGSIDATVQRIRSLVDDHAPLAEVLRTGAEANLHRYPEDAGFLITIPLRMTSPTDPELAQASSERHHEAMTSFASLYDALLGVYGRRMRAPRTTMHLAETLGALSEGFAIQMLSGETHPHVRREDIGEDVGSDWTLLGLAVEAIVERYTEPIDSTGSAAVP